MTHADSRIPLVGRVAIVTGAARGIGAATARRLAQSGARVVLADLDGEAADVVAKSIGEMASVHRHDVTSRTDWEVLVEQVIASHGAIDILVNNAGVFSARPMETLTNDDFGRMMAVSTEGTFWGLKTCLPHLANPARREQFTASVINLGSVAAMVGFGNSFAYSAAKGAVRQMSKSAAIELAGRGVRVNCVHPGFIETDLADNGLRQLQADGLLDDFAAAKDAMRANHPIGRLGRPEDVAAAIHFLATDEASFITGADIAVDGGLIAQ